MAKVKILKPGATHNLKPVGEVDEIVEIREHMANAMVATGLAERVDGEDAPAAETPAEKRETATDEDAEQRETREAKPAEDEAPKPKRGPGRPRKTDK